MTLTDFTDNTQTISTYNLKTSSRPHDTEHIFSCQRNVTTLNVTSLWTTPVEAAAFIGFKLHNRKKQHKRYNNNNYNLIIDCASRIPQQAGSIARKPKSITLNSKELVYIFF